MSPRRSASITGLAGLVLVVLIATALGKPASDTMALIVIAGGAALVTGVLGALALHLLRGRSFSAQVVAVALTSTAAVTAGSLAAGNAMFLEVADLQTLAVVVTVGAVVAVIAALLLGDRVGAASRSLGEVARRLGDPSAVLVETEHGVMPESMIREFAALAAQLEATRRELDASREREQAIDRARRELVSWVSHDLRTPLSGIRAITELLEDDIVEDPEEVRGYYVTLRREADKLSALVGDLFEVSMIEAGALTLDFEQVVLADLLADTLAGAIPVAEQRGVRVTGRVDDESASIEAALSEVSRVLRNLVANAVRESVPGGEVSVELGILPDEAGGPQGFLRVTDTCGGIPDDVIGRVFEPSFRGEVARTPRLDGGAGLGLAIARGFVEAHGGTIGVRNVGPGCRFEVRLPVSRPPMGEGPASDGAGAGPPPG